MKKTIKILKALSDETRFKIVEFLLDGEKCVCEIIPLTKRTQSTVSIQLSRLEKSGIIVHRKDGRKAYYKIKDDTVCDVFKALGYVRGKILKKACCMKGGCKNG